MKQRLRSDYPTIEALEEEVGRRKERARLREQAKNLLLLILAALWAWMILR